MRDNRAHPATSARGSAPRDFVAEGFRKFLHENFAGPEQVSRAFYVDERTAQYWWAGRHVPNGVIVCLAFGMHPESAARHLRLVVDNPEPLDRPRPSLVRPAEPGRRRA